MEFSSFNKVGFPYWSWLGFIEPSSLGTAERSVGADLTAHTNEARLDTSVGRDTASTLGVTENRVASIQRLLKEFGYDPGPIDGILGTRTIREIREYQREAGLEVRETPQSEALRVGAGDHAGIGRRSRKGTT